MRNRKIFLFLILLCSIQVLFGQTITQTIRGKVIDKDSKKPLAFVSIIIEGSNPQVGTISDADGNFKFIPLPVGRYTIQTYFLGYEPATIPNILTGAGKEVVLTIEMNESVIKLDEIVVKSRKQGEVINEMSTVSARSFSVEETKRYAGSFNDPARMASSYAGVTGDASGDNSIVIRGNSPRGLLWRLEGIDIPNPNHFSEEGASGGPISILNSNTLSNSDFFSGAFSSEYGNALSGVFDLRLRKGNNEKKEYSLQAGVIGTDCSFEGPFVKNKKSSYLINYRYSTLAILNAIGIKIVGDAVPKFQDMSFNLCFPTNKAGTFTLFGIGGISHINEEDSTYKNDFGTSMAAVGLTNVYFINNTMSIKSTFSTSGSLNLWKYMENDDNVYILKGQESFQYINYRASSELNKKFNAKHTVRTGAIVTHMTFDLFSQQYNPTTNKLEEKVKHNGGTELVQSYINWKYRLNDKLTFNSGIHFMYLTLNGNNSLEPRAGLKYQFHPTQSINIGFGIHSRMESISNYLAETTLNNGSSIMPNKNVGFTKAYHYVLGYDNILNENLKLKIETYYQQLFNVPIVDSANYTFSALNMDEGYNTLPLKNKGTGKNYGIDITLEKYYSKKYYFMLTSSLYNSTYIAGDGIERNTRYNGKYVINILGGKEFNIGKESKKRVLSVSLKGTYAGGRRYTPILLEESRIAENTVRDDKNAFSAQADNFVRFDLKLSLRREKKKTTRVWELDIQNVTNSKNMAGNYYDNAIGEIVTYSQLGFLPSLSYRIEF